MNYFFARIILSFGLVVASVSMASSVDNRTIMDAWSIVKIPPAPQIMPVKVDPKSTALLLLDFNKQTCNVDFRPRCVASIPRVAKFLAQARAKRILVIYSISLGSQISDIAQEIAPLPTDLHVQSGPDKFLNTNLEQILKDKGIKTVIVVGTAAHGAVLYTASGSALRGLDVILPVDGLSSEMIFEELYTIWQMKHAPLIGPKVLLTSMNQIT